MLLSADGRRAKHESALKRYLYSTFDHLWGTALADKECAKSEVEIENKNHGLDGLAELGGKEGYEEMLQAPAQDGLEGLVKHLEHFKPIIDELKRSGHVPGKTLFGFPWDWRGSLRGENMIKALRERLEAIKAITGLRADVLAHGEGGRVILSYMSHSPNHAKAHLRHWFALGTPWRGTAAGAVSAFLNGRQEGVVDPFVGGAAMRGFVTELGTAYERLPDRDFAWNPAPQLHYSEVKVTQAQKRELHDEEKYEAMTKSVFASPMGQHRYKGKREQINKSLLFFPQLLEAGLKGNTSPLIRTSGGQWGTLKQRGQVSESESDVIVPREWNDKIWGYAEGSWSMWRSVEKTSVRLYNIVAEKHRLSTPFDLSYTGAVPGMPELRDASPVFGYSVGDGIVPRQSGMAPLYPQFQGHVLLATTHTGLLRHPRVMGLFKEYTGTACSWDGLWPLGGGEARRIVRFFSTGSSVHAQLEGDAVFAGVAVGNQLEGRFYGTEGSLSLQNGLSLHTVSARYHLPASAGWAHATKQEVWLMRKALAWSLLCLIEQGEDHRIPCKEPSWRGAAEATTVPDEDLDLTAVSGAAAVRISHLEVDTMMDTTLHVDVTALDPRLHDPHRNTGEDGGRFEAMFSKHCGLLRAPMVKCMRSRVTVKGRDHKPKPQATCAVLTISPKCGRAEAAFYPCHDPTRGGVSQSLKRELGKECEVGVAKLCAVPHGKGVQPCLFGFFSKECRATLCDPGYDFHWSDTGGGYACYPPDASGEESASRRMRDCGRQKPFWCDHKGTCAETEHECTTATNNFNTQEKPPALGTLHPEGSRYVCPDGEAKSTLAACRFQDDTAPCSPSGDEGSKVPARPLWCELQGSCVTDLHKCYPLMKSSCPPAKPHKCTDGRCVGRWTLCHAEEGRGDHTVHCEVSQSCHTQKGQPGQASAPSGAGPLSRDVPIDQVNNAEEKEEKTRNPQSEKGAEHDAGAASVRSSFDVPVDKTKRAPDEVKAVKRQEENAKQDLKDDGNGEELADQKEREVQAETTSIIDATSSIKNKVGATSGRSRAFSISFLVFLGLASGIGIIHFGMVNVFQHAAKNRNVEMVNDVLNERAVGSNVYRDHL